MAVLAVFGDATGGHAGQEGAGFVGGQVAEGNVFKPDVSLHPVKGDRVGCILNLHRQVQDLEYALEADQRLGEFDRGVGQRGHRPVQLGQVSGEGHDGADGEDLNDDHIPAYPEDQGRADSAGQTQAEKEPAAHYGTTDSDFLNLVAVPGEFVYLIGLAAKELREQRAAYIEGFVHHRVHSCISVQGLAHNLTQHAPHPAGWQNKEGKDDNAQKRQPPFQ